MYNVYGYVHCDQFCNSHSVIDRLPVTAFQSVPIATATKRVRSSSATLAVIFRAYALLAMPGTLQHAVCTNKKAWNQAEPTP